MSLATLLLQRNNPAHMNRIVQKFASLQQAQQKGFIVYIGAGDPDLKATQELALAFDRAGVDVLELGVPFSDPLADGLVNQLAAQRGLESGTTPPKVLGTVAAIRHTFKKPPRRPTPWQPRSSSSAPNGRGRIVRRTRISVPH